MKKTSALTVLALTIGLAAFLAYCIYQIKYNIALEKEVAKKKHVLLRVQDQQKHMSELEKQDKDLEAQEVLILKRIPANEKQPLVFIKTLMSEAVQSGLKDITINVSDESLPLDDGLAPIRLEINLQGNYSAFLSFFERLMNTERLFTVEMLKVDREESSLPNQKIYLQLLIYTLSR